MSRRRGSTGKGSGRWRWRKGKKRKKCCIDPRLHSDYSLPSEILLPEILLSVPLPSRAGESDM
jgi:hypothetical protein